MYLDQCSGGRENNLNIIRFFSAILVILSHSFPIVLGSGNHDWLSDLSNGQIDFGGIAVSVFFFYGGFLICRSVQNSKNAISFFKARFIRLVPPLAFVTFGLTFFVGPIITELSLKDYFCNRLTYRYLLNSIFVLIHNLPGVFSGNPYDATVNGPLWTLPVEFLCYVACYLCYKMNLSNEKNMKWTILPVLLIYAIGNMYISKQGVIFAAMRPVLFFYIGMLCYIYRKYIKMSMIFLALSILGLIIGLICGHFLAFFILCFPYLLLWIAFGTRRPMYKFGHKFELSYGMYLCGWPVQQILVMKRVTWMTPFYNFLIATMISIILAFALNILIEKPIQKRIYEKR